MSHGLGLKLLRASLLSATILAGLAPVSGKADIDDKTLDNNGQLPLPSGQFITPTASTGAVLLPLNPGLPAAPKFVATGAIKTAVSPDGKTLLVLTSGFNLVDNSAGTAEAATSQYIFVYDISRGHERRPLQKQVIQVPNAYVGLAWAPGGSAFYVSGGSDDKVWVYTGSTASGWTVSSAAPSGIALGHGNFGSVFLGTPLAGLAALLGNGIGFLEGGTAAGLGLSSDGGVLAVANIYSDSISVIDTATNTKRFEYDLRPYNTTPATGAGVPGGEAPFTVAVKGTGVAYVSSIRDREVVVVNIAGASGSLIARIPLPGNPNSLLFNADQSLLYVTQDNSDQVAVIDTTSNQVLEEISTIAPPGMVPSGQKYTGAAANNLALSPDGRTLYVTNGGANSVAIIPLTGSAPHTVAGLVPTAWYPSSVSLSSDGAVLYIAHAKSDPGKNPGFSDPTGTYDANSFANQYILQLDGSNLLAVPVPGRGDLGHMTAQVAANNGYNVRENPYDQQVMRTLHQNINHIIYIIKENRTYDQILGDLPNGANGDPSLALFGKAVTPNFHRLAQNFVTLDNFFCSGEVSGNGWAWSTEARESDHGTKTIPPNYASRGASNDSEGANRFVNVGIATATGRNTALNKIYGTPYYLYGTLASALKGGAANLLPGTNNDFATDGPNGLKQAGYIWDAALRAGLTVRDYGFFNDIIPYNLPNSLGGLEPANYGSVPVANNPALNYLRNPFALGVTVATSTNPTLAPYTDPYFRGFDTAFPDVWRVEEWQREFNLYVTNSNLPNLTLLRLMHDHMGSFPGSASPAVAGLTTPETQQADNDLAVGRVVDAVAHSPYAGSTLIVVVEDDAQDGPDHVDAHRSPSYIVGPYVKHHAVVSTRYSTVNIVRTIEDILGLDHLGLNDAYQRPMTDVFDLAQANWTYSAIASTYLANTQIATLDPTIRFAEGPALTPIRTAEYWGQATRGFDWSAADRVPAGLYNEVLWEGLRPGTPYPTLRSGEDLRRRFLTDAAAPRD